MPAKRFDTVPEHWKQPFGPYHEAPADFGGGWYIVTPFTGPEPWRTQQNKGLPPPEAPADFIALFGDIPQGSTPEQRQARDYWLQRLRHFKGEGQPEWATAQEITAAIQILNSWGVPGPVLYEGRYGWMALFNDSVIGDYEVPAITAIRSPHNAVAGFQIEMLAQGLKPEKIHPWVPPSLIPSEE